MADTPDTTGPEEWRAVPGWEGLYEVSSRGRVRSLGRTRVRLNRGVRQAVTYKPRLMRAALSMGYPKVSLKDGERCAKVHVHRLVCEAWHGPPPPNTEVAHNDGTRTNNTPANLRWASRLENMRDKIKHGTALGRDEQPQAKIRSADLREIHRRFGAGARNRDIFHAYPISRSYVCKLRKQYEEGARRDPA